MKVAQAPSPGEVLERLARKKPKLTVTKMDRDRVLSEGDSIAFQFLGNLLLTHAQAKDCGDQFSPKGAGSSLFTKKSTLGLYLHRLPCTEGRSPRRTKESKG